MFANNRTDAENNGLYALLETKVFIYVASGYFLSFLLQFSESHYFGHYK